MSDFERIYSDYFTDVSRYALSLTLDENKAGELVSETFFRAMKALPSFRGECEIRIWLCHIAKNIWLDEKRKSSRYTGEEIPEELPDDGDFQAAVEDRQRTGELFRILHGLDEPYKEVFSLRVFGELPFSQIGELFSKTEHWACVTYHRAKDKIREALTD